MKKQTLTAALLLTAVCLLISACAAAAPEGYDYRYDTLEDEEHFGAIAERFTPNQRENALKLHCFGSVHDFLAAMDSADPESAIWNTGRKRLLVPSGHNEKRYVYFLGSTEPEEDGRVWKQEEAWDRSLTASFIYEFAFYPDELNEKYGAIMDEADSVYLTQIFQDNMCCIVIFGGGSAQYIPFAARPEFFSIENGVLYTQEQFQPLLKAYDEESRAGWPRVWIENILGGFSSPEFWLTVVLPFAIIAVSLVIIAVQLVKIHRGR